ncbi:MAG: hypothetical protein IPL08_14160 [Saprospiraceae bacterium]|nr:hypothetical protein [Saprospiraceae bacterium]
MKTLANRRDIIKSSLAAAAALLIPETKIFGTAAEAPAFTKGDNSYLVKHGSHVSENKYLWSVMKVTNEQGFLNSIDQIVKRHKYFTRLTYSSNDKFKVAPAKEIIDLILNPKSGVSFQMTLVSSNPNSFKDVSPSELNRKSPIFMQLYCEILVAIRKLLKK